jgi:L,D-peptidoglycan transpeptidase YkuD (ErfK/YbiS/YcfS/YnhG family)
MVRHWVLPVVAVAVAGSMFARHADAAPATASKQARRDIAFTPGAVCDVPLVRRLAARHPAVRQFVVVTTADWADTTATVQVAAKASSGEWRCQQSPVAARVGQHGVRPLVERRSGDGTTPAGVFPLGNVQAWDGQQFQFFGNQADPGVRGAYRHVQPEDCWGATPHTASYQRLVNAPGCGGPDEWLQRIGDVYMHAAVIGANLDPVSGRAAGEPAYAAAIFLHRNSYAPDGASKPTSGCVSLAEDDLGVVLRLIDPALGVQFAIGPLAWLTETA